MENIGIVLEVFPRPSQSFQCEEHHQPMGPPTENDTDAYIRAVVKLTGLGGNENFPRPSRATSYERMESLIRAMTTIECGIPYGEVDVEAIREGFDLAFPGKRKLLKQSLVPNIPVDIGESQLID